MYSTILFPTDGSEESLEALDHALDIANRYEATLHALYVVDTGYPYGDFDSVAIEWGRIVDALQQEGEQTLDEIERRAGRTDTAVVRTILEDNVIHRAILQYADQNDVDLIVMGTHGRRGIDRWLLGSVTERVMRTADVPVLTVRSEKKSET